MSRDENLLIDFLLKKAHKMKLCQQKNVHWICVLNLNFRLWNQHKVGNNLHIQMTHDLICSDSKCGPAICESASVKSVNYKPNNVPVATRPICNLL